MQKLWAFVSGADDERERSESGSVVVNESVSSEGEGQSDGGRRGTGEGESEGFEEDCLQFRKDLAQLDASVGILRRFAVGGFEAVAEDEVEEVDERGEKWGKEDAEGEERLRQEAGDLGGGGNAGWNNLDPDDDFPSEVADATVADGGREEEIARDAMLRAGSRITVKSAVRDVQLDSSSCESEGGEEEKSGVMSPTTPVDAASEKRGEGTAPVISDVEAGTIDVVESRKGEEDEVRLLPAQRVVTAFTGLAEVMVRGDRVSHALWDRFMEHSTMKLIVECLEQTSATSPSPGEDSTPAGEKRSPEVVPALDLERQRDIVRVQAQVLRTLSILVHSVIRRESLYCLFASNHINMLLSFNFDFSDDEVLLYFMSAVKTIGLSLDDSLVQLFFDARAGTFPLYTATTRFYAHPDGMVRIAVRNVSLTIFTLTNPTVTDFTVRDPTGYLTSTVDRLGRLCGEIARGFEFLLDDGREHRRAVSARTLGRMRQKIRLPQLQAQLAEVDNVIEYLNDVVAVDNALLRDHITDLLATRFLGPFFRPIASQASPDAVRLSKERWGFRAKSQKSKLNCEAAISVFDAAARSVVLAYLINLVTNQRLGDVILSEITKPSSRFQRRTTVHGLRAMASDLTGKERTTLIAFTALEAIIRWECVSAERLSAHGLTFELAGGESDDENEENIRRTTSAETAELFSRIPSAPNAEGSEVEGADGTETPRDGMLLSLGEFKAPLTPTSAISPASAGVGVVEESETPTSPSVPCIPDAVDDEGILALFGRGEASLREIVSAIVLVVRTHEVRTVRLVQTVARIVSGVGLRAKNWRLSLDVAKIALDELASNMTDFLASSRTTIVAIEAAFENFQAAALETSEACAPVPELWTLLQLEKVIRLASELPVGANRRRRSVTAGGSISPVEWEDAATYFVLLRAYERVLTEVIVGEGGHSEPLIARGKSLYTTVGNILRDEDSAGTYIDKKEALARVAHQTLKYSWRVASP